MNKQSAVGKFTPGPWIAGGSGKIICTTPNDNIDICSNNGNWKDNQDFANAQLIASAPELLEACKEALSTLCAINEVSEGPMAMPSMIEQRLQDAIDKAEGRT